MNLKSYCSEDIGAYVSEQHFHYIFKEKGKLHLDKEIQADDVPVVY